MLGNYISDLEDILKAMERKVKSSDDIFDIEDNIWELSILIDKLKELHEQINELVY